MVTECTVVGAGVIGLSVAVRLAQAGGSVRVVARDRPLDTTSAVAAAIWYPYLIQPFDRALTWSRATFDELSLLATDPDSGVCSRHGVEWLVDETPDPWWVGAVPALERLGEPPPGYRDGWSFVAPVVEMPIYLAWLERRLLDLGGSVQLGALDDLEQAPGSGPVVNCTGLGAESLVGDLELTAVRGQVVVVEQVGLDEWFLDESGPTYVIPRSHDIVLGGTDVVGATSLEPDASVAADIVERASALVPAIAGARVLGHRVGLRPARSSVRLELGTLASGRRLVHCYGHGGAGVTTSWGCADEVAALVRA